MKCTLILFFSMLLLVACSNDQVTSTETRVPTSEPSSIGLQNIPTLGFVAPIQESREVPIEMDDPRFPIEPAPFGKALYETHCAECHGINGEGQDQSASTLIVPPPHNSTGHTWHHPDQQNFATVYLGRHFDGAMEMPGFSGKLSVEEIFSILAYIKTFWGEDELAMQAETTRVFADQ